MTLESIGQKIESHKVTPSRAAQIDGWQGLPAFTPKGAAWLARASRQARAYWHKKQKDLQGKVSVIDPLRQPLREVREAMPEKSGHLVYRASTGGKWGKSAQVSVL